MGRLVDALDEAAGTWGSREFIVVGDRDDSISFCDLARESALFARALMARGIQPGDRVAIAAENSTEWAVAAFGTLRAGAVVVGLNTAAVQREMTHYLQLCEPRVLIVQAAVRGRDTVREWLEPLCRAEGGPANPVGHIVLVPPGTTAEVTLPGERRLQDWDAFREAGESAHAAEADLADRTARTFALPEQQLHGAAAILFTSGTTSLPKGVVLRDEALWRLAAEVGKRQQITPDDKFYSVAPFFHCSGFMHAILTCLIGGATLFTARRYSESEMVRVFKRERITLSHGSSVPVEDLARRRDIRPGELTQFRGFWGGGTRTTLRTVESKLRAPMCKLYGLTETGGNAAISTAQEETSRRLDTDGSPLDGVEIAIVPTEEAAGPAGAAGEIAVRGWNLMTGYFRDLPATRKVLSEDGWFRTGDLGQVIDGQVIWLSRLKDIIRVSGENVAASEIEEVLLAADPRIAEVAVVAAPDPRRGEVPIAFVRAREGCELSGDALLASCRGMLADFKIPREVRFVDDFPRTEATKRIQKEKLRAWMRENAPC